MKTLKELLIKLESCDDAIQWVQDRTIEQAVTDCHRADWILWLATKMQCDKRKLVLCGGLCANIVRHLMTDERSTKSVDTAIAYGQGNASDEELYAAWEAAGEAAWDAVGDAAWAAARAAAWAAAWAASEATALKDMADIIRPVIGQQLIYKVNENLS